MIGQMSGTHIHMIITVETPITFKSSLSTLRGTLHAPVVQWSVPAVVVCHGYFQSNRIGPFGLYVEIARALASNGIGCLRFDCAGFGESEGDYLQASYRSLSEDLSRGVAWLRSLKEVDYNKVCIIGHSLGGNIAIDVASADQSIAGICLLSPNASVSKADVKIFSSSQLMELETQGVTMRRGIPATKQIHQQIHEGLSHRLAGLVKAKTLIVYGECDPYYTSDQYSKLAAAFSTSPTVQRIALADHNYLPVESRSELKSKIVSWIKSIFDENDRLKDSST